MGSIIDRLRPWGRSRGWSADHFISGGPCAPPWGIARPSMPLESKSTNRLSMSRVLMESVRRLRNRERAADEATGNRYLVELMYG